MPSISVIIVNFNAGQRLRRCLQCLEGQTSQPLEIIVADNGSSDGSFDAALQDFPQIKGLRFGENLGFAAANNAAAQHAEGEWLALRNPDAYAEPGWIEALDQATHDWPETAAFGSLQLDAEDPSRLDGFGDNLHALGIPYRGDIGQPVAERPAAVEVFAPCAAAALYHRSTFLELGGFDEAFFCYCEDVDFGFRLRLNGGRSIQLSTAVVLHEGSGITGRSSDFSIFHGHRNRLWMWAKNAPSALFWLLLPAQVAANIYFVLRFWGTAIGKTYRKAMRAGYARMLELRRSGSRPSGRLWALLKCLTWSPSALRSRTGKTWTPRRPD